MVSSIISIFWGRKFPKFESRAFSCSTQTSEISPGFLKGYGFYFEIGKMIVEEEQQGKERAEYGKQLLEDLAFKLTQDFGKGFSVSNLRQMRAFYLTYSIQQKSSAELQSPIFRLS
jgi:hypothetical protein